MALRWLPASLQLPLLGLSLLLLALGAWWPTFQALAQPSADQVWEAFGLAAVCQPSPSVLGWMGPVASAGGGTLFGQGLFGPVLPGLSCRLAQLSGLEPLQSYLLAGLAFTALLAFLSCRWAGLRVDTSLLTAFLISTAPSSFSRVGHISLAVLIPVVPTLVACLQLRRSLWQPTRPLTLFGTGALAALLTFPSMDYYVVFSLLLVVATFALLLLIASAASLEFRPVAVLLVRGGWFLAGFLALLVVVFLPKLIAAGLINFPSAGVAGLPSGVPATWGAPRNVGEQFRYGLLPFTWFIPSPWLDATLASLRAGLVDTSTESFAWSAGSLLIPISWIAVIRRLAQRPAAVTALTPPGKDLVDADRRFLALLLLLVTVIGLLVMTMGGLGTLFAAFVSPVLRSLNRFTAFVYGAAVLYLVAEFDLWLQHRDQTS